MPHLEGQKKICNFDSVLVINYSHTSAIKVIPKHLLFILQHCLRCCGVKEMLITSSPTADLTLNIVP